MAFLFFFPLFIYIYIFFFIELHVGGKYKMKFIRGIIPRKKKVKFSYVN